MWSSRCPPHSPSPLNGHRASGSYVVANNDRTIQPELERFATKRMNATIYEVNSSHVPMLSNPALVLDIIRTAAREV